MQITDNKRKKKNGSEINRCPFHSFLQQKQNQVGPMDVEINQNKQESRGKQVLTRERNKNSSESRKNERSEQMEKR